MWCVICVIEMILLGRDCDVKCDVDVCCLLVGDGVCVVNCNGVGVVLVVG